uniref:DNA replication helicase n=1 Tax=Fibrocapsa japonica TaxID=94617 RepID=UPI0021156D4E|nr:DNA replication helicase [Fibrocapsa japonica]UTE95236.1 DNA replication helicase [Fibrocapsa japonica]
MLPYNFVAEEIVLGAIMLNPEAIRFVSQNLNVESFYLIEHQLIYKAALVLQTNKMNINLITLGTWLYDNHLIEKVGGFDKLNHLVEQSVLVINLQEYITLIQEKFIKRLLIKLGREIVSLGYMTNISLDTIFSKIEKKIIQIRQKKTSEDVSTASEVLNTILLELKQQENQPIFPGFFSGYKDLDSLIQGFQKSDLIIIAGRPSMGKTAFSLNIARNIVSKYKVPIILFSLEMTKKQLMYRLLSIDSEIETEKLRSGRLNRGEWKKIKKSVSNLSSYPIYINDTSSLSVNKIKIVLQKIKSKFGYLGCVIIDYLQLLEGNKKIENRVQEISHITRHLKAIAREFLIPVIVLSQLSRNVESRLNKRPLLSDLRESGCLSYENILPVSLDKKKLIRPIISIFSEDKNYLKKTKNYKVFLNGIKPIYKIITNSGFSLYLTGNHKILTKIGWLNSEFLNKSCKIAMNILFSNNLHFKKSAVIKQIFWEKIALIEYVGLRRVYDITVPRNKNFLSNGVILHNSIEQDADIVLMLYRENYYERKNLQKDKTEIIISKHRNGPTGSIDLLFKSKYTNFINVPSN